MTENDTRQTPHELSPRTIEELLQRVSGGSEVAIRVLFERTYEHLRHYAHRNPYAGRPGSTMQPTALVHELFLRLDRQFPALKEFTEREYYRRMAWLMRELARDAWRKTRAARRGGGVAHETLSHITVGEQEKQLENLIVTDALTCLEAHSTDLHDVFTFFFLLGMTTQEVADVLELPNSIVTGRLRRARAFLWQRTSESERGKK